MLKLYLFSRIASTQPSYNIVMYCLLPRNQSIEVDRERLWEVISIFYYQIRPTELKRSVKQIYRGSESEKVTKKVSRLNSSEMPADELLSSISVNDLLAVLLLAAYFQDDQIEISKQTFQLTTPSNMFRSPAQIKSVRIIQYYV